MMRPVAPGSGPPLLVGRAQEQEIIAAHLRLALAGQGGLIILGGEAGIGKTTLAERACRAASAEGARASLRFGSTAERRVAACSAARRSMQWLLRFSGQEPDCSAASSSGAIVVSPPAACSGLASAQCVTVTVSYDYSSHPFLPGTGTLYGWVMLSAPWLGTIVVPAESRSVLT